MNPLGTHPSYRPSNATTRARQVGAGNDHRACPPARPRPPWPPHRWVSGGLNRVLTVPGRGSLAMTTTWTSSTEAAPQGGGDGRGVVTGGAIPCLRWSGPFHAPCPSPSNGRSGPGRPPPPRTRSSPTGGPAGPFRAATRTVGPRSRDRPARSRRAARMGPRSRSVSEVRRRTSAMSTRLATRACSGHAPRCASLAPKVRSASPRWHRVGHTRQLHRVERAVGVHEAHHVVIGRREPGGARRAKATAGLEDHFGT